MKNVDLIKKFYQAFSDQNANEMVACYHNEIEFEDPAFGKLRGEEVRSMWRMLIQRAKGNLAVTSKDHEANEKVGSASWTANYNYGPKKRKVENHVKAHFEFKDGLIWRHKDTFNIWKWSGMALGLPGTLLGWTPFLQNKIQKGANESLQKYMSDSKS